MRKLITIIVLTIGIVSSAQYSIGYIQKSGSSIDTFCLKTGTDSLFKKNGASYSFAWLAYPRFFIESVSGLQSLLDAKQSCITNGTSAQYIKGDLSLATFPTALSAFTNDLSIYPTKANNLSDLASAATARTNLGLLIGTDVLAPNGSAASLTGFPTFNQNTTGKAAGWTTGRTLSITGDIAYTSPSFDGTANVTAAGTLSTVNSNTGAWGSATQIPTFTVNGKGLITAASNTSIQIAESQVTNLVSDLALKSPLASPSFTTPNIGAATGTSLAITGVITSSGGGIGYATGNGGTVTQATSKSTGVTLNKLCGTITMNGAALAAATIVTFTVTNSTVAATDVIIVQHDNTGTTGAYTISANTSAAGSFKISVRNNTAGSLSEAIVIRFTVIKAVTN